MASANSSLNIPSNQSPLLLLNNMSNLMSTKLDSSNFMIWKLQITAVLDAYSMLDHLDGSIPKPNQFLTTETGIQAVNSEFLVWSKKDKALLSLLYSTCSSSVLAMVVGKSSSQEVWNTLEERFTSTARSSVLNLKLELQSLKKTGNESVSSYLQRIKTVRDKLSAVGVHSDQEELTHVILKGLPKEYAPFASAIRTRDTVLSLERLTVLLQTEEQSMNEITESLPNSALAMFVSHNKPHFNGNQGFNRGRGRAINPTTKLAAMASASNLHYTQNAETWLTDTGATDHITANANNLSSQGPYQGQEQVSVGNGQNLPIQNIDLWGPAPVTASNDFRFYLVFVDEFTKFTWVYLLKHKSDTFQVFTQFRAMIETQFSLPIKILRTDCGGEFLSTPFNQFCLSKGIIHQLSCPHTPQQNGVAERKHRHLVQCALALLSQSKLPLSYWSYAISTAAHIINKLPTPNLDSTTAILTASSDSTTAILAASSDSTTAIPAASSDNTTAIPVSSTTVPLFNTAPTPVPEPITTDIPLPHSIPHPMQTRSKSGIVKPKLTYAALIDYAVTEPTSYTVASKHSSWCTTMDEEFQAFQKQGTWSLIPLPLSKVVGCKWVYKLKTHSDGTIARYKARLVAKGQLDVKNVFLHGTLKEEVYMTQPQGYVDPIHPQPNMLKTCLRSIICLTISLLHLPVAPILDCLCMMGILSLILMPTEVWLELCIILPSPDLTFPLQCTRGTFNHGIEFTPGPLSLSAYTDADWAGDPDDRRSTSGFLVYLGHNAITWSAKKQATVSRSSTESEYRALAIASVELCWVRCLFKDLGIFLTDPPTLWCDNVSALAIASNPVFHARTKHIVVDFHFVRERVLRKDLVVKFVSTVDQLADIFTKSLSTHCFLEL
uniref:Integrase catalytic domain-containing protein n=1 Tax=Fagus sylvatica TaxID=28930 RepID=A0A2N9FUI2_FAGSY